MSNAVVIFCVFISCMTCIEVMFEYEASDHTGDQMPDQFNVAFSTETKFLTKFNLRRSQNFDANIPLYTLDKDREGFFQKQKVKIRPRKAIGYYHDMNNKAVFCIKRSSEALTNNDSKFHLKAVIQMDNSEYLFDSNHATPKKPWRNLSVETISHSTRTESTTPRSRTTFDQYVYKLELLKRTTFEKFDTRIPPPQVEKTVRWKVINQSTPWSDPPNRRPRSALRDHYVDVVALIDVTRFIWFLSLAKKDYNAARRNIQEHYAMVFSGVDMLYRGINHPNYTIHIRLCKIFVFETFYAASFIDKHVHSGGKLDSVQVLNALEQFFLGPGLAIVGTYDHVMLFTGYDLFRYDSPGKKNNIYIGSAFVGTMCRTDGTSCGVVEDFRGPDLITIAHEIGHSFSAKHDGDGNSCSNYDRHIMSSVKFMRQTPATKYNPWQFSTCSVNYFTTFLAETVSNSHIYSCLATAVEVSDDIPDVSNKLLGQLIKPHQHCQLIYGKNSFYCKGARGTTLEDICHSMYCRHYVDCELVEAYIGTSCGDGKICINGKCVSDPYAPEVDETCVFGDIKEDHCKTFISKFVGNCYQSKYFNLCCGTCKNMSRPIRGCEYGDKKENCQPYHCAKEKTTCCGTCNYGTPFTPITTRAIPMRPTSHKPLRIRDSPTTKARDCQPGALDLKPELCYNLSICQNQYFLCCDFCSRHFTLPTRKTTTMKIRSSQCSPGDTDHLPRWCTSIIVCQRTRFFCCDYCSRMDKYKDTTTTELLLPKDCAPGDFDLMPGLCTSISICLTNRSLCCDYCSRVENYTATSETVFTSAKDCAPGDFDLMPGLCTSISICLTKRSLCCDYCSRVENYTVTSETVFTSDKDCAPGDFDLMPGLCTNISICLTDRSQCCDYCSRMENYTVTITTTLTSPNECVPGEPDLNPELCTMPSVCLTEPLMCCNYCSYNSGTILSIYNTWIYRFFYILCIFFLSKQMSA